MRKRRLFTAAGLALALAALAWRAWGEGEIDLDWLDDETPRTCDLCSCTDQRACPGGCTWARVWERDGVDVCSRCADKIKAGFEYEHRSGALS